MQKNPLNVALIYGSAREGRFCDTVAGWVRSVVEALPEFRLAEVDPRHLGAGGEADADIRKRIGGADAYLVVTPEYNHGYPAALKALIDGFGEEWHAKPVGFVSYGGVSGGLRAVEQLRLVFAELHAVGLRDSVSFANAGERFDAAGRPLDAERVERSLRRMLATLEWWAAVLRHGRRVAPYDRRAA